MEIIDLVTFSHPRGISVMLQSPSTNQLSNVNAVHHMIVVGISTPNAHAQQRAKQHRTPYVEFYTLADFRF